MQFWLKSLLSICVLVLGACTTTPESESEPVIEYPDNFVPEPQVIPEPEQTTETQEEVTTPPPQETKLKSADFLGLEPAAVQDLLGPVSLKRWEGEIQVMQFLNEHCVVDIYFYETAPGQAFEVTYLKARNNSGENISSDICLSSLLPGGVWAGDQVDAGQVGK